MAREGIIEHELGITEKKGIWFNNPSEFAKENLFYPTWGAEYVCTAPYKVERKYLDAFMFQAILDGEMHYRYEGEEFIAGPGQIVFLDCHRPNCYWAEKPVRKLWIHFNGNAASKYHDYLYPQFGACYSNRTSAVQELRTILHGLYTGSADDHTMSCWIHRILADLAVGDRQRQSSYNAVITPAIEYIQNHYDEDISVEKLAALCSISPIYLTRLFQKNIHRAPHDYLLNVRLTRACTLLTETGDSVERIAELCGFSSSTHFIRMFRKWYDYTPLQFRRVVRGMER